MANTVSDDAARLRVVLQSLEIASAAVRDSSANLATIVALLKTQDRLEVSGTSLALLLMPIVGDMNIANDELEVLMVEQEGLS